MSTTLCEHARDFYGYCEECDRNGKYEADVTARETVATLTAERDALDRELVDEEREHALTLRNLDAAWTERDALRALVVELCEAFEALDKAYCDAWAWSAAEPLKAGREVLARARAAVKPHG